jgi:WD40 repeat protein
VNLGPKELLERYQPKQGQTLTHDRQLGVVRFSPDGKVLAAGALDGTVRRWDAANAFAPLPPLLGHNGWVQALAFHPDSKRLFTADSWGRLCCWPFTEKEPKPLWSVAAAHDGWVRRLVVSPDGGAIASCGVDRVIRFWSADAGKKLRELAGHEHDVYSLAFHPDGKSLVSGDLRGVVKHWDLASGKAVRAFDASAMYRYDRMQDVGGVRWLAFDRAGAALACGGGQPSSGGFVQGVPLLLVIDWPAGKVTQSLKIGGDSDGFVLDAAWHPDGFVMGVTSGQPGQGKLFFHRPGDTQPFFLTPAMPNCHALAVHPNLTRLVVSATNGSSGGNGRVLDKNKEYAGNWSPLHIWDLPVRKG